MQNEKMQVNLAPGMSKAEIIVREVKEVNELPVKAPLKIGIKGTLNAVIGNQWPMIPIIEL